MDCKFLNARHARMHSHNPDPHDLCCNKDMYQLIHRVSGTGAPEGVDDVRAHGAEDATALVGLRPPRELARGHWEQHICLHYQHIPNCALPQVLTRLQECRGEAKLMIHNHHLRRGTFSGLH